jgi:S-DNA-T family DNA segregation ATPase FtsK/SpoIIIE
MLALCILFFCLSIHFSFSPFQFFLTRIKILKELSKQNSAGIRKETQTKEPKEKNVPDEVEVPNKEDKKKKWKLPWNSDDGEDDLLFGDVSKDNSSEKSPVKVKAFTADSVRSVPDEKKSKKIEPTIFQEPEVKKIIDVPIEKIEPIVDATAQDSDSETNEGMEGFKVVRAAKTEKAGDLFPERKGDYHFPPMELLMEPPEEEAIGDDDHILKAKRLQDTLREFKIEVEMGEVHTGPVITRYDLHPAAGVRVEKIANLDKNLAMALKAESVRILAPVPGKGCVGIEVPNATPMPVCMKEILQSKAWHEAGAEIPIVLGKEASGRPLVADLTKMPHLLVAGSTGSGKTVCINAIIASLCYHSSPEDVRFIMVDPKIVEMKVYNDLPHMLIPVVTEPKKVPGALKWLLIEMERRYQIFSKIGVRNIAGFNAKILKDKAEKEKAQLLDALMTPEERAALSSIEVPRDDDALEIPENKLPYIVCIIDELADLMMVAQADVETGIARLAQLARAAGIHLIIATQRPSVNVITGVIKANLPSRISFRVASYRDSMTILDGKGAEALIGKGDMLFIPPGSSTFARAQGAFVSDDEINGIVDFLKINGPPQIIEEVRDQIDSAGEEDVLGGSDDSDDDPMTKKAIEIIRSTKRASTSNLQRKLSIGYNRAARIMDDLEDRGLVGPDVAGQGREILMDL